MVKHIQTIRRLKPTNCLSEFDHFVGLALNGLMKFNYHIKLKIYSVTFKNDCQDSFMSYLVWLWRKFISKQNYTQSINKKKKMQTPATFKKKI